jgi:hypothetical protein
MSVRHDEAAARTERARPIGLFRYQLIREAADPEFSPKARGRLVRQIAAAEHLDPSGRAVRVSRDTLDRWIRAWRAVRFDALVPNPRQSTPGCRQRSLNGVHAATAMPGAAPHPPGLHLSGPQHSGPRHPWPQPPGLHLSGPQPP